jgi:hypothetical protein
MSTIIVAAIILGAIAAIFFFLIRINNKQNREAMKKLLNYFSQSGTASGLVFSSQEVLKECVFGIDGTHRKVLVVNREHGQLSSFIIDLRQVKNCSVKKIYGTIQAGDLNSNKLDHFLEKIILQFESDHAGAAEISFYRHSSNHVFDTLEMEKKAKEWQAILSKMISPLKKIA